MKSGVDYLASAEKMVFDRRAAHVLKPVATVARLGARATFGYQIYSDVRIGQHGETFEVHKIQTLDEYNMPIDRYAALFRRLGLDEAPQISSIESGQLSLVGRRQLIPKEYEYMRHLAKLTNTGRDLLAEWDDIVLPYKCGLLSSFSLESHTLGPESIERRLELDIHDSLYASKKHDRLLIKQAIGAITANRLQHGSLPILPQPNIKTTLPAEGV